MVVRFFCRCRCTKRVHFYAVGHNNSPSRSCLFHDVWFMYVYSYTGSRLANKTLITFYLDITLLDFINVHTLEHTTYDMCDFVSDNFCSVWPSCTARCARIWNMRQMEQKKNKTIRNCAHNPDYLASQTSIWSRTHTQTDTIISMVFHPGCRSMQ